MDLENLKKKNTGIGSSRFFIIYFFSENCLSKTGIVIFNCKCSHNQPMYRLKKSSQLFCKYLHNSATKHLICRTQDLNLFHLKKSWGVSRNFWLCLIVRKESKKTHF